MQETTTRRLALIAMLGALSAVLMTIYIPLPFAPSFMRFDVAELPSMFAGFFLGPVGGCLVVLVKIALKLLIQGTDTAFVGEFSNILHSISYMLPAALIYRAHHSKKGAVIGLAVGTVVAALFSIASNALIMFPMYSKLYELPMEAIIGMGTAVNPFITDEATLMLFSVFPFNLFKCTVTSVITYLIYKRVGAALRRMVAPEAQTAK